MKLGSRGCGRVPSLAPGLVNPHRGTDFDLSGPTPLIGIVQFLCSDASRCMTGQNVVIDGGRSVW